MKMTWWVPGLLSLRRIARTLSSIDHSLKLLAGRPVDPVDLPEDAPEPATLADTVDFAEADRIRQRLAATLKREPTPEEIVRELDGVPHGPSWNTH
jgi:hypothetical protein